MKNHPLATREVVAILCITLIVIVGALTGHNDYLLYGGLVAIAGIAGYELKAFLPEGIRTLFKKSSHRSRTR